MAFDAVNRAFLTFFRTLVCVIHVFFVILRQTGLW